MRNGRRKCVIHIGTHKTGSSAIQNFLSQSPEMLEGFGYVYPASGRSGGHHNIAFYLFDKSRLGHYGSGDPESLFAEISQSSRDLILSSEEFTHAIHYNSKSFQAFIDRLRIFCPHIVVVVYLRRQDEFILSNYLERLKYGLQLTFMEYMTKRLTSNLAEFPLDYEVLIRGIEHIDHIELVVKSYDPSADCIADFLTCCGINATLAESEKTVNARNSLELSLTLFYTSRMNRELTSAETRAIQKISRSFGDKNVELTDTTKAIIRQTFANSNSAVAKRFGVKTLVDGLETPKAGNKTPNTDFSNETLQPIPDLNTTSVSVENIFSAEFVAAIHILSNMPDPLKF